MTAQPVLLCADEPIRVPGAIQPHGVLLAVTEPDLVVVTASENAVRLFGREVQGASLDELLDRPAAAALRAGLTEDLAGINPLRVLVGDAQVDVIVHRADGLLLTEWEPSLGSQQAGGAWHRRLPLVLQRLSATDTLDDLSQVLVSDVRQLTGFDRVMLYRFDAEWNGEVIAEDRRAGLEPFLGLHFPAGDIPAQARALYVSNWLRLIPDATYRPVALTPGTGRPLDLSGSVLRSVSPVHLEYLANMGVRASMSVSLLDHGRLWGLIACHHYAGPHRPSYTDRAVAEFLGRTASVLLGSKQTADAQARILEVAEKQTRLVAALARGPRAPHVVLTGPEARMLDLLPAGGAALFVHGQLTLSGSTPPADRVVPLVRELLATGVTSTHSLASVLPDAHDVIDSASGLLVGRIGAGGDFLAWFRPETLHDVSWGGDPNDVRLVPHAGGTRLSPRLSFEVWTETVRATALPWAAHEVAAAEQLGTHLTDLVLQRSQEDNRLAVTLQRTLLLEQLPVLPGVVLAARYLAAAQDVVGGDWYDVIPLPNGKVSLVLGDVAGHGLSAAAITAQLRHGLRAYLLRDSGPSPALQALNELVTALLPHELATAIVAELDPRTGEVSIASAGHLPVLHLSGDGGQFLDNRRGPALGVSASAVYEPTQLTLAADDRLVLFTDGLVESRTTDLGEQLVRLQRTALAAGRGPDVLLDAVLGALAPTDADDVTLLAVGLDAAART